MLSCIVITCRFILCLFCEDAPEYHIMAAGSLLGVAVKKRRMTVPVGKVRVIRMYPLSFKEFLRASDIHTYEYIEQLTVILRFLTATPKREPAAMI